MAKPILLINGPNLNLLGKREPELYGYETIGEIADKCKAIAKASAFEMHSFHSNHEGKIIDVINQAREEHSGIIINPAAFTHTSVAIMDALKAFEGYVVEVHLTNLHRREKFRHHSYISFRADGIIAGCGAHGYELATIHMVDVLSKQK